MTQDTPNFFGNNDIERPLTRSIPNVPCPKTWFVESLLVTLFCFFPLGLPAMWFASKVESAFAVGNYPEAEANSRKARMLVKWSMIIGAIIWAIGLILYLSGSVNTSQIFTYSI